MSKSKIGTWIGLVLIAIGGAAGAVGHSVPAAAVLIALGAALTAVGQSLFASAAVLLLLLPLVGACNGSLPPNVVQAGVATVETAICIVNTYSKDKAAGQSEGQAIADCIKECSTDAATITSVLDANHAAMLRERMLTCGDGGQ